MPAVRGEVFLRIDFLRAGDVLALIFFREPALAPLAFGLEVERLGFGFAAFTFLLAVRFGFAEGFFFVAMHAV